MLFQTAKLNLVTSLWSLLRASSGPPAIECCCPIQDLNSLHLPAQSHLFFPIPGSKWPLFLSSMTQKPRFSYISCLFPKLAHLHPEAICSSKTPITTYQTTGYHKHKDHNKRSLLREKLLHTIKTKRSKVRWEWIFLRIKWKTAKWLMNELNSLRVYWMPEMKVNTQLVCARRIQRIRLYEHSLRETKENPKKIFIIWNCKKTCPRGRLRSRWRQQVTKHITHENEKHMGNSREGGALDRHRDPVITQQA
jgi:hypothetical protein